MSALTPIFSYRGPQRGLLAWLLCFLPLLAMGQTIIPSLPDSQDQVLAQGIFQGINLIMMVYSLINYIGIRDKSYLFYALYLFSISSWLLIQGGIVRTLLLPQFETGWYVIWIGSINGLAAFYLMFGKVFLKLKELLPRWNKILNVTIRIIGVLSVAEWTMYAAGISPVVINTVINVSVLLEVILVIGLNYNLYKTRSVVARFFIAGSGFLASGGVIGAVADLLLQFENILLIIEVFFGFEILAFSVGLSYRLRLAQHEKLKAEQQLTQELRKADSLKDEFLANTSHELRTPLHGITGIAESLLREQNGELSKRARQELSLIVASGNRLVSLVNDILDFSRLRTHNLSLKVTAVDIHTLVDIVLKVSQPLIAGRDLQLLNEIPQNFPLVSGDPDRLQQVLHNLVGNAIKFTEKGSVRVTGKLEDGYAWISVIDTGVGIPYEKQPFVKEAFVDTQFKSPIEIPGIGLGLPISKQLISLHGGKTKFFTGTGKGSTFCFSLPLSENQEPQTPIRPTVAKVLVSESETSAEPQPEGMPSSNGSQARILIVDDESINQHVLQNHLKPAGYETISAYSGKDALKLLEQDNNFDLILLDIMMPGMSGYEVCQQIREKYLLNELPILIVSAKNQVKDLVTGLSVGANDYLAKPFTQEELLARVKTQLQLRGINNAYERFVPHEFLHSIGRESIMEVQLGDFVQIQGTVMFSDIRSYTTVSEGLDPEDNFLLLNSYLGEMGPIIRAHEGFVHQYYGDGILALFLHDPGLAIEAAMHMQKQLEVYNQQKNHIPLRNGIGLHRGALALGVIGDELRMETGVVSDTVNTSSRLEGLNKVFGTTIIVSETVYQTLSDPHKYAHRFLGKVKVKGKSQALGIYEFFEADEAPLKEKKLATLEIFEEGLNQYFKGNFAQAAGLFRKVKDQFTQDQAAEKYLEESAHYLVKGIPEDWDGIIHIDQK